MNKTHCDVKIIMCLMIILFGVLFIKTLFDSYLGNPNYIETMCDIVNTNNKQCTFWCANKGCIINCINNITITYTIKKEIANYTIIKTTDKQIEDLYTNNKPTKRKCYYNVNDNTNIIFSNLRDLKSPIIFFGSFTIIFVCIFILYMKQFLCTENKQSMHILHANIDNNNIINDDSDIDNEMYSIDNNSYAQHININI